MKQMPLQAMSLTWGLWFREEVNFEKILQTHGQMNNQDSKCTEKLISAFIVGELTRGPQALTVTWV